MRTDLCRRHRFHASAIQTTGRLHHRFTLGYRDFEELLAEHGVDAKGEALDVLLQARRDKASALRFMRKTAHQ